VDGGDICDTAAVKEGKEDVPQSLQPDAGFINRGAGAFGEVRRRRSGGCGGEAAELRRRREGGGGRGDAYPVHYTTQHSFQDNLAQHDQGYEGQTSHGVVSNDTA
jgi:hypothetical protein